MINFTNLKAGIEDGSINETNIDCYLRGKNGYWLSSLKWLSDAAAAGEGANLGDLETLLTTISTNTPATAQRTATTTLAVADGSSAAGARSVIFGVSSDFSGTIDGIAVDPAQFASVPYVAPDGDTLDAVAYTVAAGSLLIVRIA